MAHAPSYSEYDFRVRDDFLLHLRQSSDYGRLISCCNIAGKPYGRMFRVRFNDQITARRTVDDVRGCCFHAGKDKDSGGVVPIYSEIFATAYIMQEHDPSPPYEEPTGPVAPRPVHTLNHITFESGTLVRYPRVQNSLLTLSDGTPVVVDLSLIHI